MMDELGLAILNGALDERVSQTAPDTSKTWSGKVVRKGNDGTIYVDILGGEHSVPCSIVQVSTDVGHIVQVRFQDGRAIIVGDTTDPAAPSSAVAAADKTIKVVSREVEVVKTQKADVESLTAAEARIDELSAGIGEFETVVTEHLEAATGRISDLEADHVSTQDLTAVTGEITNLKAKDVEIEGNISAATGRIDDLESDHVSTQDLTAVNGEITNLKAKDATIEGKVTAAEGDISQLQADTADIDTIRANSAKVQNLTAEQLETDHATIGTLDTTYAKIDGANITNLTATNGWLDKIMVQTGMLSHTGTIYELDAIQVNASSVKTGTLDVERLIVTQTDAQGNQQKYLVHVDAQGAATYQKMDGNVIQDLTITTEKLVANAVTADKITTQNIEGTGGWINLRNGTFAYLNATTGEGIAWDGQHLTIAGSVTVGSSQMLLEQIAQMAQDADANVQFKVTETYNSAKTQATVTAHVYKGGVDIATDYPSTSFAWFIKNEDTVSPVPLDPPNGYSITLNVSETGYGSAVVCRFTPPNDSTLLDSDDDALTDSNDTPVSGRTPSGDYVRIVDLEATTTVFDTDRLLLVGSEEEQLVSIATLKDVFGDGDYIRLVNKPSIEGVTLSGDKTFQELGIFQTDGQGYDVPDDYTLSTLDINALWANAQPIGA